MSEAAIANVGEAPAAQGQRADGPEQRMVAWGLRAVLIVAVILRLVLALVNLEANDDHMAVSRVIAFEHRLPAAEELHQAYHPQLYHAVVGLIWRVLPDQSLEAATRAAQLLNALCGVATLLVILRLLRRVRISPHTQLITFALIALNPRFVAINIQASNDTFAILFGTLTLYCGYIFFERWTWSSLAGMCASAVLMMLSKANGLIPLIAIGATFAVALWRAPQLATVQRRTILVCGLAFGVVYFAIVPWLGPYAEDVREHGTFFVSNHEIAPFPDFVKQTHYGRPGATSIVHGVMTFRYVDLLLHPMNSQHPSIYPAHRTSYWSQLYGRFHFAHFERHPESWRTRNPVVLWLGRLIFVLALWPTALLVIGFFKAVKRDAAAWLGRGEGHANPLGEGFLTLTIVGFLSAGALFALRQRNFSSMNAIYIMPGLLAFVLMFARAHQSFLQRARQRSVLLSHSVIALLLGCYVLELAILIYRLR